jgi:hypothetical protein
MTPLRGNRQSGYHSTEALECPCCHGKFDLRGVLMTDQRGSYILLYPVAPSAGEYDAATLRHVMHGPPQDALVTGVALPQDPGRGEFRDDPVPTFEREDR